MPEHTSLQETKETQSRGQSSLREGGGGGERRDKGDGDD